MNDITDLRSAGDSARSHRRGRREATHLIPVLADDSAEPTSDAADVLAISCDDCSMRCTSACDDCLVTFVVEQGDESLVLDLDQARVVRLLGEAGLVPDLKFRDTG